MQSNKKKIIANKKVSLRNRKQFWICELFILILFFFSLKNGPLFKLKVFDFFMIPVVQSIKFFEFLTFSYDNNNWFQAALDMKNVFLLYSLK